MRPRTVALLVLASIAVPAPGRAAAGDRDAREVEARKACQTGDYQRRVALLADLFTETDDPNYVFNQGRCYQENGRAEEAINRFREYLRKAKGLGDDEIAEVKGHIREMEELRDRNRDRAPPAPVSTTPGPEGAGRKLRLAGLAVAGVGVAVVAVGVAFGLDAQSQQKKAMDLPRYDGDLIARGQRSQTLQWVVYIGGGAVVAIGAVLYFMGRAADERGEAGAGR